jgi:hypothetical protein
MINTLQYTLEEITFLRKCLEKDTPKVVAKKYHEKFNRSCSGLYNACGRINRGWKHVLEE